MLEVTKITSRARAGDRVSVEHEERGIPVLNARPYSDKFGRNMRQTLIFSISRCKMSHNIEEFLLSKPHDIFFPAHVPIQDTPPFVPRPEEPVADESTDISTRFDPTTTCPVYEALGYCTFGWKCRFLGAHVQRVGDASSREGIVADAQAPKVAGWEVVENPGKRAAVVAEGKQGSMNQLTPEESKALQRKRVSSVPWRCESVIDYEQFPYPMSAKYLVSIDSSYRYDMAYRPPQPPAVKKSRQATTMVLDEEEEMAAMNAAEQKEDRSGNEAEMDDVPLRPVEKKRLEWRGKTYLAPLTTVGNLVSRPLPSRNQSLTLYSHSDNFASTTEPTSHAARWCSANRWLAGAEKNGP